MEGPNKILCILCCPFYEALSLYQILMEIGQKMYMLSFEGRGKQLLEETYVPYQPYAKDFGAKNWSKIA